MNAQTTLKQTNTRQTIARRSLPAVVALLVALSLAAHEMACAVRPAAALGPDRLALYDMVRNGQGAAALDMVAAAAQALGGWQPAPGDQILFDAHLSRKVRGASQDFDELPFDCADPTFSDDEEACRQAFAAQETQVRFGRSLFSTPSADGDTPRPAFDDLLSTYIEEVGHSWQEYLYETDGRGGARTRQTTLAESEKWSNGREYQIKMYILSLDGTLLTLSDDQRDTLRAHICGDEGYANPLDNPVPPYGAPAGWPNPQGWPVSAPTVEEFGAFCAGAGL